MREIEKLAQEKFEGDIYKALTMHIEIGVVKIP